MRPIQLQCQALLQVACVRVVSNQVLFDHMKGERAYTLLKPLLTVYFLQGSIYETFYKCCYYFRAVATLWPSSDVNQAMVMELSSKNYFKSSQSRVHRPVHVLIKHTLLCLCQVSFIKNKELNVFFRSLYKNDACFYKKNPPSVQVILLPKKDNVYQLHACSLYS